METYWLTLVPKESGTWVLLTRGQDELLRAVLPPLRAVTHEQGVKLFLEGLSLWLGRRLCVALSAADPSNSFRLDLTDEMGVGAQTIYYAVTSVATGARHGRRIGGLADFEGARRVWQWASTSDGP